MKEGGFDSQSATTEKGLLKKKKKKKNIDPETCVRDKTLVMKKQASLASAHHLSNTLYLKREKYLIIISINTSLIFKTYI